ncbi:nitrophenyl compound nitroreductase subunit ArsF family protein [Carboxylicivirga sp. N1Y90]|uniref:nitrophenyl compound nitroreductase subunit ArsF family protein n=1 Tax=Carboxylicivirga fragile TaxID=3417571 RepID=UPI003D32BF85|nr:hypothetical protein [Marinilabiliaceae bacterium N1Y90]
MNTHTKFFSLIISVSFIALSLVSCNFDKQKEKTNKVQDVVEHVLPAGEIHAYYFHATRRCATCEAVEAVTTEYLKNNYADKVVFTSINREEQKNSALLKAYKVDGQTLLIVKDDKLINLTNDAFLNARTNPDKLEAKLKETIDALL